MKLQYSLLFMFVTSFIIQYFLMPPIMVDSRVHITNNIGKVYLASIMAFSMLFVEIIMHDHQYHTFSMKWYLIFGTIIALFTYLYRNQVAIDDKQYIEEMIEHHSMALFTSKEILKKTDNYHVAKLAKNILQTQTDELRIMQDLLSKKDEH